MKTFLCRCWKSVCTDTGASVGHAALLLAFASVVSRVLGVVRDRLLATTFGAGPSLDAYYAAFRLPDTLYHLIILGALSAGFVPLLADIQAKQGKEAMQRFSSLVLGWFGLTLVVSSLVGMVLASRLVPFLVPGFDPERLALTIDLTRLLFLSPLFLGVSAVCGGVLQSARKTLTFAFAPVFYNVGILFGITVLTPFYGIKGVAIGVLLGALLHMLLQGVGAWKEGLRFPERLLWTPDLRRLLVLTGPRLAALGASQISLVVMLAFAASLRTGSVSVFQLANNLQSFPLGVVGISFAIAAFPLLSEAVGKGEFAHYHETLGKTGKRIVFFLLPLSLLIVLLRAQMVRLVLGDGAFDWQATIESSRVVGWLAISLVAQALIPLLARAFYALHSTWTPFAITLIGEVCTLVLAWQLKDLFGISGLAIACSVSFFLQASALWFMLRRRVGADAESGFLRELWCVMIASAPAMALAWLVRDVVGTFYPLRTFWQVALQFGASASVAGTMYLGMTWFLDVEETKELFARLRRALAFSH